MISATHFGTCQLCGKQHKAPGNLIAKHGYTLEHGYFNGTCRGSDAPPFELSKDVAEQSIVDAKAYQSKLIAKADAISLTGNEDGTVWALFRRPVPGERYQSFSRWEKATLDGSFAVAVSDGLRQRHSIYKSDANEIIRELQNAYANTFRREAAQLDSFVAWQTERCAKWAPAEMKPIPAEDEGKGFVLRYVDGSGYVARIYGRTRWEAEAVKTADKEKAQRFTERGAKQAQGKVRGYKTMEVVAL